MHLSGGIFESIIPKTVDELEKMKPKFLIPCHCTGLKAMTEIAKSMPDAFIQRHIMLSIPYNALAVHYFFSPNFSTEFLVINGYNGFYWQPLSYM